MLEQAYLERRFLLMKKTTPHKRSSPTRTQETQDSPWLLAKHMGKSLLITIGTSIALLLIFSLIAYFYADPDQLIQPLGLIGAGLAALIGGLAAVRIHGHSALICGLLNGCAFTVILLLFSLFFRSYASGYSAGIACLLHTAILLFSVAGAFLGLRRSPKSKHKRR